MLFSTTAKQAPLNKFPLWKYIMIVIIVILAVIYALPMIYGESPAVQLTPKQGKELSSTMLQTAQQTLSSDGIKYTSTKHTKYNLQYKFAGSDVQMKAYEALKSSLGKKVIIALNLVPNTPNWLRSIGANPMKLGLDLRGGMYFLLDVDMQSVVDNNLQNYAAEIRSALRTKDLRYSGLMVQKGQGIVMRFRTNAVMEKAESYVSDKYPQLTVAESKAHKNTLIGKFLPQTEKQMKEYAVQQTVTVMRNRVNELGVSEASVAQQGLDRIVIELPGLQDAARAKEIIGGTSTLKVMLVNEKADTQDALHGKLPIGSSLYRTSAGRPYVLYNRVIITGKSVVGATPGFDSQSNQPVVNVKLSGPGVSRFSDATGKNVGNLMAIVLVDQDFTKTKDPKTGKMITKTTTNNKVVSVATILQRLGNSFQITGLSSREAQNLALNIRAGALPAPVQIVAEKHIGPSLGKANIRMGAISVTIAMILVLIFVACYYRVMGLIANVALVLNLILIVAVMAIIPGATLTLPGIAGIVLNVGMAIDANVLIFERIREEIRNGTSMQAAIHSGYERAFGTIVDSNVTTLIVAVILFAIGTGAIQGFAVTLIIGILMSMFTSITVTRAIVNLVYGGKSIKKISIGIKCEPRHD